MRADELREKYLEFFESKGCVRRPSDVLVPRWDPSVLFTPAGMNQFKDHFLGRCKLDFTRATTCQKCLRTGDIDNVGRTAYHHTFFEMLGNFSFGDYFKREAITWAWEFLTSPRWMGIDPAQLSVTVYVDDEEAAAIWQRDVGLEPARIERLGEDENFWPASAPSLGPDGVCGPCSEIYHHAPGGGSVEIWNLVFTQFNRVGDPPDNLRPLPSKNIDTGMGLERMASVLQGVDSNFHIDILRPLVEAAGETCGVSYQPGEEHGRRLRRIADHVRACTFAIHENVTPGPKEEKYVVRQLLRRAVLDGRLLGVHEPFLHRLVGQVAELMKQPYPELSQTVDRVAHTIQAEEEKFFNTIDAGLDRIQRIFTEARRANRVMISGSEAAEMYTTHGFPPELFESLAAEHNMTFDWEGFRAEMEQHGIESGAGRREKLFQTGPLDSLKKAMSGTTFLGYETTEAPAKIVGIIAQDRFCDSMEEVGHDEPVVVVLDQSPFYGESGGQVGDRGELVGDDFRFEVIDTQRDSGFILHLGHLKRGALRLGAALKARVDRSRRQAIRRAHSATHLLHHALHVCLGPHAQQQGSKVDDDWLRFDFSHPHSISHEDLARIEAEVNARVLESAPVTWTSLPIAEAREAGAMMLFGEKYPDIVRMVTMGDFSRELCGGTHLDNTIEVGLFKITGEESVAAGTRRITALTGQQALRHVQQREAALSETAALLKVPASEVPARVAALAKEVRDLRKQSTAAPKAAGPSIDQLLGEAAQVHGTRVIVAEVPGGTPPLMRQQIDLLRKKHAPAAVMLGSRQDDKVTLIAGISRDLAERGVDAVDWIRSAATVVGGSGGGRQDMAQAGGRFPDKLPEALASARTAAEQLLSATG